MRAADEVTEGFRENRRRSEDFRKGVVTHVDTTGTFTVVTVNGRPMATTMIGLAVGDVINYYEAVDPFVLGKFAGT